jgi:excinuclease ABC subunit B
MAAASPSLFRLVSDFLPSEDQRRAVDYLAGGLEKGESHQVLLGVTGSGKTFTMANIIAAAGLPTLVISHNKTLAAQLYNEFLSFFPENAVEYFVSYYDYYQPEAYLPQTDTYIEKDSSINDDIDKLRHSATRSVLERRDVVVIASVSCIYGLGSPENYGGMMLELAQGDRWDLRDLNRALVGIQYRRNDLDLSRGTFRVRGDTVDIFPAHEGSRSVRLDFFGDLLDGIREFDPLTGKVFREMERVAVFPGSHFVIPDRTMKTALESIRGELKERLDWYRKENKLLEAQRLEQRTAFDLEMIEEIGYCSGIENYSRHLTGRSPGEPPPVLLDYFPKDFLVIIDESHVTIPQLRGMASGDRSRKKNLIDHGFRLPSAYDNRPLTFEEFSTKVNRVIYVSATPAPYEMEISGERVAEQIIRPTGLMDPAITVRPAEGQVDDLIGEIRKTTAAAGRVLVTTLTKRMAEDLTDYLSEMGVRVKYLHSEVDTIERMRLIRDLRMGKFDVLVGINLLREGLDIPEVSLVAILDSDKEGFLRSQQSLIQTAGRAARNIDGRVIMYADQVTGAMDRAIQETNRRRTIQTEYNHRHRITPESIKKSIKDVLSSIYEADYYTVSLKDEWPEIKDVDDIEEMVAALEVEMKAAASRLEFEKAARIRDQIASLKKAEMI